MHYRLGTVSLAAATLLLSLTFPFLPLGHFDPLVAQTQTTPNRKAEAERFVLEGNQQYDAKQYQAAIESYQQAVVIYRSIGNHKTEAKVLTTIGATYYNLQQYPQALKVYQQALTISRSDHKAEVDLLIRLGGTYYRLQQYPQAIEFYQHASTISRGLKNFQEEVRALNRLAMVYRDLKQVPKLIDTYKQAVVALRNIGDREEEVRTLNSLAKLYSELKQPSKEIDAYEQMQAIACVAGDHLTEGIALLNLSRLYTSTNQDPKVSHSYEQTPAVAQSLNDYKREACELVRVGIIYNVHYRTDQAIQVYQQALIIYRNIGERQAEASVLGRLGSTYQDLEQYPKAIASYEQELAVLRNLGNRQGEIGALAKLAELYRNLEQYTKMIEIYQQSLAVSRAEGDRKAEVDALFDLGDAYRKLNQDAKAIEFYEKIPAVFGDKGTSPEETLRQRQQEANALKMLGSTYLELKQYDKAIKVYQQVLAIAREIGRGTSNRNPDIAAIDLDNGGDLATFDPEVDALINLSVLYHLAGQSQTESELYQQALAVSRALYGRKGEFYVVYRVAGIYDYKLGQYPRAIELYLQALTVIRRIGDLKNEIYTLLELGKKYLIIGPYQKAIESYQQATEIYERKGGIHRGETQILVEIGIAYHHRGEYAEAIRLYEQVINITNNEKAAFARVNLGVTYHALGQYQKALDSYQQALTFFQKDSYRRKFNVATTLDKLGMVYQSLGQYQAALKSYQQSLGILQKDKDVRNETALVLDHLGVAYRSLGQTQQAIESHQQALEIFREISNRGGEANVLNNVGEAHRCLGQYDRALRFYQQSLAIKQEIGDRPGEGLALSNLGNLYNNKGQYADAEQSLFKAVEIWETLRAAPLKDENKISLFDTQADTYRYLQQALIAQNKTDAALEVAERGRARAFVELLAKQFSKPNTSPGKPPSLEQIKQIAKQENATLVEYSIIPNESVYIWVVKPTGEVTFRKSDLKPLQQQKNSLAQLVSSSRDSLGLRDGIIGIVPRSRFQQRQEANLTQQLQQLHQLLIEPIADQLPNDPNDRVIFMPQAELFLVPFPALKDQQGKYLIEKHTILTAPAIQVLDLTRQQRDRVGAQMPKPLQAENALVVGNPTMPSVQLASDQLPKQLASLPGAEQEAIAIASLLHTTALTGNAATETAVKAKLPQARIVHLATHGLLDDTQGLQSAIALAPNNSDNGLLTAEEILKLKLNASLVVLSACNTGQGYITGDGVIGLSRALFIAGTPSVIVSLWAVPDAPTQELMTEFYHQLEQTGDKARSLRQAMLKMQEKYPNTPKNWAAFTLLGESI